LAVRNLAPCKNIARDVVCEGWKRRTLQSKTSQTWMTKSPRESRLLKRRLGG
jgi:hypothetical protein